jgi:hypothetical protein
MDGDLMDRFFPAPEPAQVNMGVADEVSRVGTRVFQAGDRALFIFIGRPDPDGSEKKNEEQAKDEDTAFMFRTHLYCPLSYIYKTAVAFKKLPGNGAPCGSPRRIRAGIPPIRPLFSLF